MRFVPRRTRCIAAAGVVLILACVASKAARPDDRFKLPSETVLPLLTLVGIEPTIVRADVPNSADVAARIDGELFEWLDDAEHSAVPADEMRPIEARALAVLGGLYDPATGRLDRNKAAAFQEFVSAEYRLAHAVEAFVRATVVERQAALVNGSAEWDGVSDPITGKSGLTGFLIGGGADGHVAALSLKIEITDPQGRVLYAGAGGLQPLTYANRSLEAREFQYGSVEARYVMSDPLRDRRAIAVALDPLVLSKDSPAHAKRAAEPLPIPASGPPRPTAKDLAARYRTMALARIDSSRAPVTAPFEARLTEAVRRGLGRVGLSVAVREDYERLWSAERERAGGYYDPMTGAVDRAKLKASRRKVIDELAISSPVAALVLSAFENRIAPFAQGYAEWDGVSEMVSQTLLGNSIFGAGGYSGELEALSLRVVIIDATGEQIYEGRGGLQLLSKLSNATRVPVAPSKLLSDQSHDTRAVDIALHGLAPPKPPG